jgi:hypothetical protein
LQGYSPELGKLHRQFEKLQKFQQEYPQLPISDVHEVNGGLLDAQGKREIALTEYELAWSKYNDNDGGYVKFGKAFLAGIDNLWIGKVDAAQRWCHLLGQTEIDWPSSRCQWYLLNTEIALYRRDWREAEKAATQSEKKADLIQGCEITAGSHFLRVRTILLQPELGDPIKTTNPARFRLRQAFVGKPDLEIRCDRVLLIADYRLACIRYLLRMPPVDDRWYQQPQEHPEILPSNFTESEFKRRVQLTERSICSAMRQATYLDNCFQCTWRQEQVQKRSERLNDLVIAVNKIC